MSASVQNSRPRARRPHNYVPNRGGHSNSNSHRREIPDMESPSSPSNFKGIYDDPRTAAVMCSVLGSHSTVKTRNGNKYKGHTTAFSEKGDIAMVDAKLEAEDSSHEQHIPGIVIPKETFVVCVTNGVDVKGLSIGASDFTDSGITSRTNGSSQGQMKELQPWLDDDGDVQTPMTLDDDQTGGWEPTAMFQQNKDKFNLTSSFKDDLRGYTTDLPDPTSDGYKEREMFARRKAEEIENSSGYQSRIAKENDEGDEEAKFSSVHRGEKDPNVQRVQDSRSVQRYVSPALRGNDNDHLRNGNQSKQGGHPGQRQNSPNYPPQSIHNSRQHMSSHFQQGPPLSNRNQRQQQSQSPNNGPPPLHSHHHPHNMQQAPPLTQVTMQQQQQQSSRPPHPSQVSAKPSKPTLPHHPIVPSVNHQQQQLPPQQQQQHVQAAIKKTVHPQQAPMPNSKAVPSNNSQQQPSPHRPLPPQHHVNGEGQHISEMKNAHKPSEHYGTSSNSSSASPAPLISGAKVSEPSAGAAPVDHNLAPQTAASPPVIPGVGVERRTGRGQDASPEENRNKVKKQVEQLRDFSNNFVLDDSSKTQESSSESTEDSSKASATSCGSSGIGSSESSSPSSGGNATPAGSTTNTSEQNPGATPKGADKSAESDNSKAETSKSTLNPLAAEFKPKSLPVVEVQASPPPSLRVSSHAMPPTYNPNLTAWVPAGAIPVPYPTRKVLPMGRDFPAQVTGQPLLAHGQIMYMPGGQGQSYQMYTSNARMMTPNSFHGTQAGQQAGLDQSSPQPQQVFMPGQQQLMATPMPAHLTHPQPAHGQHLPNQAPGQQQPQPAHIPNPSPSPVQQHQQQPQPQPHGGQPMPHPMPQGPPQSLTPQPAHYPHVNLQPGLQAMPRTSSGQQHGGITVPGGGSHSSVSINYPNLQYSYPNVSSAQNNFVHSPQPQMSHNSHHHNPQPQYVMMPQPQGHNPMQPMPGQPYTPSIQFQTQHNILHAGPPQMPPNHSHNPNQGPTNFHVQGMPAGMHQQVPGAPSNVLMPMQSPLQPYQPQQ